MHSQTLKDVKPARGLEIYSENRFYWQYNGRPTLLLGGSVEDNLFQINQLETHLRLLQSVGGNYVRCTLSSRDAGDVKPYLQNGEGIFDLETFNPEYWEKLELLLELTHRLEIIVQVEIWATYDFYWGEAGWAANPFNPKLNSSYSAAESRLPELIDWPAQTAVNPFFKTVPALDDNQLVRSFQQRFVDQVLLHTFAYDHILYCSDNETLAPHPWGHYWATYLHEQARQQGKHIYVTEMWDYWDPTGGAVAGAVGQNPTLGWWFEQYINQELHAEANVGYTLRDPETYQFLDISNHNTQRGKVHAQTGLWVREAVEASGVIRPINNVKIYGGDLDEDWAGTRQDGKARFGRNVFSGHASVRFHRPSAGIGLDAEAQQFIRSWRMLSEQVDFFHYRPAPELLTPAGDGEAYCLVHTQEGYLFYFPAGGEVDFNGTAGRYTIRWLHIPSTQWEAPVEIALPGQITAPSVDHWVGWATAVEPSSPP